MPLGCRARGTAQQTQALAQTIAHAVYAEQRHARYSKLNGQRDAVELRANINHCLDVALGQRKAHVRLMRAFFKQTHSLGVSRFIERRLGGQRQRADAIQMFAR